MTPSRSLRAKALHALQTLGLAAAPAEPPSNESKALSAAECQSMRQLLMLTQAEAAQWLSDPPVSERAWQYWEAGRRPVPADVAQALREACSLRQRAITHAEEAIKQAPRLRHVAVWYAKADDWRWTTKAHGLEWKLHNSVVAHIAGQGLADLVGFDEAAYSAWSESLPMITAAGEIVRHGEWAKSTLSGSAEA